MRTLTLMWLLGWGAVAGAQVNAAGSTIIALENVWNQAAASKDLRALDKLLDDNFIYVNPEGRLLTKAEVLLDVKASPGVLVRSESMVVHFHGDTAIVTGLFHSKGVGHGKPFARIDRFVDTWRMERGAWIAIASLATPLRP